MMAAVSGAPHVVFRISYARASELRDDVSQQMERGGLLVRVHDASGLNLHSPVGVEVQLPDGTRLQGTGTVLQIFAGFGVAVSVSPEILERARGATSGVDAPDAGPARHERIDRSPGLGQGSLPPRRPAASVNLERDETTDPYLGRGPVLADGSTRAAKIQRALHGTRDERNAILRDRDRTLHPFVLKNPQLDADDVVTIAKSVQVTPDLLKQIGERKDWVQRPAIALALARNPKTPPELAVRVLEHVPIESLRQMAKGVGVLPHVTQAARKKILG
jgi:hypothetical protein